MKAKSCVNGFSRARALFVVRLTSSRFASDRELRAELAPLSLCTPLNMMDPMCAGTR
jgi:hypothetical protein